MFMMKMKMESVILDAFSNYVLFIQNIIEH